jgi:hypothetical protein
MHQLSFFSSSLLNASAVLLWIVYFLLGLRMPENRNAPYLPYETRGKRSAGKKLSYKI